MADDGFNGSTISFAAADQTPLLSITTVNGVGEVPVGGAGDTGHTYEGGIPTKSTTWDVTGNTTLSKGDEGAVVVAWNDGGAHGSIAAAVIQSVRKTGSLDSPISCSITVIPTPA